MTFPTPHTVSHSVFNGTGVDELGNDVESWAEPVDVRVIGWHASLVETVEGHTSRVVSDIDLLTPPGLAVSVRDKFTLDGDLFEVVEFQDCTKGFHGWQPGNVVKLRKVTGN